MSSILNQVHRLLDNDSLLQIVVAPTKNKSPTSNRSGTSLLGYLNPIHPCHLHVVEKCESNHLKSLTDNEQNRLIKLLSDNGASHIIFQNKRDIPPSFLIQKQISIVVFKQKTHSPYQYLHNAVQNIAVEQCSIHGAMAIVNGQGILITGDSGAGKSSLLLSLIERGHLWVADDAPHIYRNHLGYVFAAAPSHLPEYLHIKSIGIINADQTFGKSKRIPLHRLAAIIHLSDNVPPTKSAETRFEVQQNVTILGQTIPQWRILANSNQNTLAVLVETIAKQLIMNNWGDNASEALITAHDSVVSTALAGNTKEMQ